MEENPHTLQGIRIEKMFAYLVTSLGKCSFIKPEDSGDSSAVNDTRSPGYKLILKSGQEFLVTD